MMKGLKCKNLIILYIVYENYNFLNLFLQIYLFDKFYVIYIVLIHQVLLNLFSQHFGVDIVGINHDGSILYSKFFVETSKFFQVTLLELKYLKNTLGSWTLTKENESGAGWYPAHIEWREIERLVGVLEDLRCVSAIHL